MAESSARAVTQSTFFGYSWASGLGLVYKLDY